MQSTKNKPKCDECGKDMVRMNHDGIISQAFCYHCEVAHLGKLHILQARVQKLEEELQKRSAAKVSIDDETHAALREWADARRHKSKSHPLDYSAPQSGLSPEDEARVDYETALRTWRIDIVQRSIERMARSVYHRRLLEDMTWHMYGEGRQLESFAAKPRGGDGDLVLATEWKAMMNAVAGAIERSTDRPTRSVM